MNREQLYYLRSRILDEMAYILVYAPNFPAEDETTLERKRDETLLRMSEHRAALQADDQLTWHRLAEQEFASAINAFISGDGPTGCSQLQQAEEHFRRSFKPKKIRPNFIVGPDGEITKT
jgi:hypothetical protein